MRIVALGLCAIAFADSPALAGDPRAPVLPGYLGLQPTPYSQAQICDGRAHPAGPRALLDVRLDERLYEAMARSTIRFLPDSSGPFIYITDQRLDLRLREGDRTLELAGIGGMHNTNLQIEARPGEGVSQIRFWYQDRPLTLAEALDRAAMLRRWFGEGGFAALPALPRRRDVRGFRWISAPNALTRPQDRAAAEAMLRNERRAIPEMVLFRLLKGRHAIEVRVQNWRRLTALMTRGGAGVFDACNGREWGLEIYFSSH